MRKLPFIILLLTISLSIDAQTFLPEENDTTVISEYNNGLLWAYRQIGDFVVGMTNYISKDDYGKNYQIQVFVKNLGENSVTFDPSLVTSTIYDNHDNSRELKVYSYDAYIKKIKNLQDFTMGIAAISGGVNAGMAGLQTTQTTTYGVGRMPYTQVHTTYNYAAAAAANTATTTQLMTLRKLMSDEKNTISQGYLRITTLHPGEGITGYINIKHSNGKKMIINVPVGDNIYSFNWDVEKKKTLSDNVKSHTAPRRAK